MRRRPGIDLLARIVRGADTDAKGLEPESYGIEAMAEGFRAIAKDDQEILRPGGGYCCWAARSLFVISWRSFQPIAPFPCTSGPNSQKVSP